MKPPFYGGFLLLCVAEKLRLRNLVYRNFGDYVRETTVDTNPGTSKANG